MLLRRITKYYPALVALTEVRMLQLEDVESLLDLFEAIEDADGIEAVRALLEDRSVN